MRDQEKSRQLLIRELLELREETGRIKSRHRLAKKALIDWLIRYVEKCQHIITPSESIKQMLMDSGVCGPITAIPTGIELTPFQEADGQTVRLGAVPGDVRDQKPRDRSGHALGDVVDVAPALGARVGLGVDHRVDAQAAVVAGRFHLVTVVLGRQQAVDIHRRDTAQRQGHDL